MKKNKTTRDNTMTIAAAVKTEVAAKSKKAKIKMRLIKNQHEMTLYKTVKNQTT